MAYLLIREFNKVKKRVKLEQFPFIVGRDSQCHLQVQDSDISRQHFLIKRRGEIYILEDLGSHNGTYVNGEKADNIPLNGGDQIHIGTVDLVFHRKSDDITLSKEFSKLDWRSEVDTFLGLSSPIKFDTDEGSSNSAFRANRFGRDSLKSLRHSAEVTKRISSAYNEIMQYRTIHEAANSALKHLGKFEIKAAKAAYLSWNKLQREVTPIAHSYFNVKKSTFHLNKFAIKDVITRKNILLLEATETTPSTMIIPVVYQDRVLSIVHVEAKSDASLDISTASTLYVYLRTLAPIFEVLALRREMDSWMVGMVETMIATVEAKDTYTRGHSERVCRYSLAIADKLKLDRETKRMLMISALCHDIGKIGIPDSILKKASLLSADEYEEIKLHPKLGVEIIKHMPEYQRFMSGVLYHHEKWDGTGYPDGLAGEDIPFFGRIICLADVFDAMVSGRSYSGFLDLNEAMEKLIEEKDLFDPNILLAFEKAFNAGEIRTSTSTLSTEEDDEDLYKSLADNGK